MVHYNLKYEFVSNSRFTVGSLYNNDTIYIQNYIIFTIFKTLLQTHLQLCYFKTRLWNMRNKNDSETESKKTFCKYSVALNCPTNVKSPHFVHFCQFNVGLK